MTIGFLFLLLFFFGYGGYLRYHAPKEVGHWSGYRTKKAMKSQANWDKAHKILSRHMYRLAIVTLGMLILARFSPIQVSSSVQMGLMLVPVVLLVVLAMSVNRQLD